MLSVPQSRSHTASADQPAVLMPLALDNERQKCRWQLRQNKITQFTQLKTNEQCLRCRIKQKVKHQE